MFHNESNCIQRNKSKRQKTKKSESYHNSTSKHSKHAKTGKHRRYHKHSNIRHINTVSDFVGPERLTKHVGIFSKGKISNSITRLEKILPKEVKARVQQDLKEVLKLTCNGKNKQKIFNAVQENISSKEQAKRSSLSSPQYLHHKTGFASSTWKDKLQKSVGLTSVNSMLDSVHEPVFNNSPVEEPQLIARKLILNGIHPFIKEINSVLFPNISSKDKLNRKLQEFKIQFLCTRSTPNNTSCTSSVPESSQTSKTVETHISPQKTVAEDFYLNPIYTGDTIGEGDITKLFPSVNDFKHSNNFVSNINLTDLPEDTLDSEIIPIQAPSPCTGKSSSVTFRQNSPTTSDDSPAWKLQISPVKFVPELGSTPTIYFRHKMF